MVPDWGVGGRHIGGSSLFRLVFELLLCAVRRVCRQAMYSCECEARREARGARYRYQLSRNVIRYE
jgi:hypothetical protein